MVTVGFLMRMIGIGFMILGFIIVLVNGRDNKSEAVKGVLLVIACFVWSVCGFVYDKTHPGNEKIVKQQYESFISNFK